MRKTKIICTLGPATDDEQILRKLFLSGMNVARLNFSHGTHDEHRARADMFKRVRDDLNLPVALLMDIEGPKIRLGKFSEKEVILKDGAEFVLTMDDIVGNESRSTVTYKGLVNDVKKGSRILIADGLIVLKVKEKNSNEIICEVVNGGPVSNSKGLNVPDVFISLPFLNDKDKSDIIFGIENSFDYMAASFTRNAEDIKELRKFLDLNGGSEIRIVSKIENRDGVDNIDEIIRVSNGVMVARGDMGVEIPFEELPFIQKNIIRKCQLAGKSVITATQMLDSMIRNPSPTRAEITDVANAIYDGTSAIMLSGETSVGRFPVEVVEIMSKITIETEKNIDYIKNFSDTHITMSSNVTNAISHATCSAAHTLGAAAIISVTKSGHTARMISKFRPAVPIIATTVLCKVYYQLAMAWGVMPVLATEKCSTDEVFEQAIERSLLTGLVKSGDLVIITGGMPVGVSGTTNLMKIHIIGDMLVQGQGIGTHRVSGNVCVVLPSGNHIKDFNQGDILVIKKTTNDILPLIKNAAAVVTEESAMDSQAVIVGRALEIPVIAGAANAADILKSGTIVTVDAKTGAVNSGIKSSDGC